MEWGNQEGLAPGIASGWVRNSAALHPPWGQHRVKDTPYPSLLHTSNEKVLEGNICRTLKQEWRQGELL